MVARGIRVNCFNPGPIDTPWCHEAARLPNKLQGFGRWSKKVTDAPFHFLKLQTIHLPASPQASYISVIDLIVDGGLVVSDGGADGKRSILAGCCGRSKQVIRLGERD
jgi:NAD(P)-dependent dehydrogenase (short-subunit alcohol dehydrogenase family)